MATVVKLFNDISVHFLYSYDVCWVASCCSLYVSGDVLQKLSVLHLH
jgi:hypothetical protein